MKISNFIASNIVLNAE